MGGGVRVNPQRPLLLAQNNMTNHRDQPLCIGTSERCSPLENVCEIVIDSEGRASGITDRCGEADWLEANERGCRSRRIDREASIRSCVDEH